jgi:hypothetical protein
LIVGVNLLDQGLVSGLVSIYEIRAGQRCADHAEGEGGGEDELAEHNGIPVLRSGVARTWGS